MVVTVIRLRHEPRNRRRISAGGNVVANVNARWELRLLGHPELRCDDGRRIDLPTKAFAIAAHLLLDRPSQQSSRAELAEFLWSDVDSTHRRANLRTLLKRIRSGIGDSNASPFTIDGEVIAFDSGDVRCDLLEFHRLLASDEALDVVEAAAKLSGPLLETRDRGSAAFERWLNGQRSFLSQTFQAAARRALEHGDLDALPEKKEALARRLIEERTHDEVGHRTVIRICAS
jgi:DNA-binding SARP family transcriptional activator